MEFLRDLFERHRQFHSTEPLMLRYAGILGGIGYPIFYLLRFTKLTPVYEDIVLRLLATAASLLILLKARWPVALKPYFFPFSWVALTFSLPFFFVFTSLKNGGGPVAVANTLMAVFFTILFADRRNMLAMLVVGFSAAVGVYWATDPSPKIPADYIARLPTLLLVLVGGSMFKLALERATAEKVRQAYASLACSIAHEMRNSLGQLKYTLEHIESALPSPTTKLQAQVLTQQHLDALYRHIAQGEMAVQRGLQVISMTLDEVHQKPLQSGSFVLLCAGEVSSKAIEEFGYEDPSQRDRVSLHVERDFIFLGDETAFLFVLFNLIKNALAYPQLHLRIEIGGGQVRVSDNGPGIAPEVLASLFQPFHTSGKKGGTGLGLAYCQRVMQAFGGRIHCESTLGKFTCFTLEFPPVTVAEREALHEQALRHARGLLEGRRLLVVDDHAALRAVTRQKLASTGIIVEECADGEQALAMLVHRRYDLMLLDLNMPGLDGYEVAERVRAGHQGIDRTLRIVAYSSEPEAEAQVKTRKAGMDGFLSKPCEQVVLWQALCRALQAPSAADVTEAQQLSGLSVLLVDDSAYNRKAVVAYLHHAGITVTEAGSGQEALALLRSMDRCDAILLDIEMPGMSGLDVARTIRSSEMAWRNVPILALTAHSETDMAAASLDAGMNDLLVKPVDMASLYGKLKAWARPVVGMSASTPRSVSGSASMHRSLLDIARLENYQRLGVLDELLADLLPVIQQHVGRVAVAARANDLAACRDALHSLIGMSGEAGAQALCQQARRVYLPVKEDRWPALVDWAESLQKLAGESYRALDDYVASART